MQLSHVGAGQLAGITDSAFVPEANRWYQFLIEAEESNGTTLIRARFWDDGAPEPQAFSIIAADADPRRLTSGHIGIWSGGGDFFVDDLAIRSSASREPSTVTFIDASTNQTLDPSKVALFGGPARIKIETTGEVTLTLDAAPYASASPIAGDGLHVLTAHTADGDVTLKILIDTTPPELTIFTPAANACTNAADIQVSGRVFDLTLAVVKVAIGSGQSVNAKVADDGTFAVTIAAPAEGKSEIVIEADDHLDHVSVARSPITIDRTRPVIDITSNGAPFAGGMINRTSSELQSIKTVSMS